MSTKRVVAAVEISDSFPHIAYSLLNNSTNSPHFPASWPDAMFRDSPSECCTVSDIWLQLKKMITSSI